MFLCLWPEIVKLKPKVDSGTTVTKEVPKESETPEVVPVDDKRPAPKHFIVKEEPKEVKQTKLGRKSLPNKSKPRAFVPVTTVDEMDSEEDIEEQNISEIAALPPARTKQSSKAQSLRQPTTPSFAGAQKTSQQNSRQKPKAQTKEPPQRVIRVSQPKPVQSPVTPVTPFKSSAAPPHAAASYSGL